VQSLLKVVSTPNIPAPLVIDAVQLLVYSLQHTGQFTLLLMNDFTTAHGLDAISSMLLNLGATAPPEDQVRFTKALESFALNLFPSRLAGLLRL